MTESSKIFFKKAKVRNRRKSLSPEPDESEDSKIRETLENMKVIQKLREKPHGVNITGLEYSKESVFSDEPNDGDPFKTKKGGMINMKNVAVQQVDDAYDVGIGTQFSVETNKRDEDEEMMKYIEQQLSKKKQSGKDSKPDESQAYFSPEDAALAALPDHLKSATSQKSEEMLSNQMLSGIPEIDLGIETKIRNIEATEEAKLKLIKNQGRTMDGPSQFVPTNITVNFAQSNNMTVGGMDSKVSKKRVEKRPNADEGQTTNKASDDFLFERFKKQFRRY